MTIVNSSTVPASSAPGGQGSTITWTPLLPSECRAAFQLTQLAGSRRDSAEHSLATVDLRTAIHEAATAAADAAARAHSLAEVLDEALAELTAEKFTAPDSSSGAVDLISPREREVLALVADGCTNKAIAETLFVSPNTVKTHITSLLHKLQANTRVQLAAIATRHGLLRNATIDPIQV